MVDLFVPVGIALAIELALVSTTFTNLAYLREHDAVAGVATLLTKALPIAAGTIVLDEPLPHGVLGGLRLLAFAAVIAGAFLLARPEKPAEAAVRMTPR